MTRGVIASLSLIEADSELRYNAMGPKHFRTQIENHINSISQISYKIFVFHKKIRDIFILLISRSKIIQIRVYKKYRLT